MSKKCDICGEKGAKKRYVYAETRNPFSWSGKKPDKKWKNFYLGYLCKECALKWGVISPATKKQKNYLYHLDVDYSEDISKEEASNLIEKALSD